MIQRISKWNAKRDICVAAGGESPFRLLLNREKLSSKCDLQGKKVLLS